VNTRPVQFRDKSNTELQFESLIANLLTRFSGLAAVQIPIVYRIYTCPSPKVWTLAESITY
jgi:hypothetical protein